MGRMDRPAWAQRIRAEREARSWSQRTAVRKLRAQSPRELPEEESLLRLWKRWEAGEVRPTQYGPALAKLFGTVTMALLPEPPSPRVDSALLAASGMDTTEILARLRSSHLDNAALEGLRIAADQLCCEYPHMPAAQLRLEGQQWLRRITTLLDQNLTLSQHREVLSLAGLVALLVGCVENDMGDRRAAEATRRSALSLGTEADDHRVMGWAHEMSAWFSLTDGDFPGVIAASDAGLAVADGRDVSVQLAGQKAKAYARMGDRRQTELALEEGRSLLETLPYPDDVSHHFVVDPAKWDFYAMDTWRMAGEDDLARTYAEEVLRGGVDLSGNERSPMRNAEARVTLGVVAAREGDLEQAVTYGARALEGPRKSLPSLLMTSSELRSELTRRFPNEPAVSDYVDLVHTAATAS